MTNNQFKREGRYFVLKASDIEAALHAGLVDFSMLDKLEEAALAVKEVRARRGKEELVTVVVEHDWPEYETVWAMIESRMAGAKQ